MKSKETKNRIVPNLRFPEFRDAGGWEQGKVDIITSTVTPPKKLLTANYLFAGKFPIIDQSQNYICGWTNDYEALIIEDSPLIIFGDHTCVLKIAHMSFAQGADGIKILKAKELIEPTFLYQYLQFDSVVQEEYKRHFSILKEKMVYFPKKKSGEQQKIADCLSSIDDIISVQSQKLEALKAHKKGLMQQLFPAEGETKPKIRFPEFRNAGEWEETALGKIATFLKGKGISKSDISSKGTLPCIRYGELYTRYNEIINSVNSYTELSPEDLILSQANDVIIPASGETKEDIATASCVMIDDIALGGDLNIMRSTVNGVFLSYYLNNAKKSDISQLAQGISIVHLYAEQLKKLKINIPKPIEQQKIADCLSSIDDLISAQSKKLEALKAHKKGLMQQLFPNINE